MKNRRDLIEVFVPTSPAPWHPSTDIMEVAVHSVRAMLGDDVLIWVYCDAPSPFATDDDSDRYSDYIRRLRRLTAFHTIESDRWCGLAGLTRRFITCLTRPIVMTVQHDWELLDVQRIDVDPLLREMIHPKSPVQCVRFHKYLLTIDQCAKYGSRERYIPIEPPSHLPLIATNGWGDSPHIATADHYRTTVRTHMQVSGIKDGRHGLERPLGLAYRAAIHADGFAKAHAKWGAWFYGRPGDAPYIRHLGGAATEWRRQRLEPPTTTHCTSGVRSKPGIDHVIPTV